MGSGYSYGGYPQYQPPMMMGGKGAKNAMKCQETTLKMVINKVCGLNFLTEKDYKKIPMMGAMMPGMNPCMQPGMMTQQQTSLLYMDKKSKKELFKRGARMFFSAYPQTTMMQYQQLEQFVTTNKVQVTQMFQPVMMPGMMPGMPMPVMPQPQPMQPMAPMQPPMQPMMQPGMQPVPTVPCQPMPGQPMPMPYSAMPVPPAPMAPGYQPPTVAAPTAGTSPFMPPN